MVDTSVHIVYKKADGTRVPSVTTYLGVLAKPALIHWAWELGVQDLDYRKVRDQAGDIGTLVHYMILSQLTNVEPDLESYTVDELLAVESPMSKFHEWYSEHTVEPILVETSLVSEEFSFGGTPDFYGKVNGKLTLLDFKTGKSIYQEAFYQVAAYTKLLEEHGYPVETTRILRVGKSDNEGFEERSVGDLENSWRVFLACREIYELQKLVKKDIKEDSDR